MMTATVPVKMNPMNLYGPEEYEEGISIAIQSNVVYVVVKLFGSVQVTATQLCVEDL